MQLFDKEKLKLKGQKLGLEIEEAEIRAEKAAKKMPAWALWSIIAGIAFLLPAYLISKFVSFKIWEAKYRPLALSAHQSFTEVKPLQTGEINIFPTGDGSFGFYMGEFDTMCRYNIPVVCVISNDSAWGMIKLLENIRNPEEVAKGHVGVDLYDFRAYEKLASIWDGYGERVTRPEEIIPAIRRGFASGKPAIINVEVDHINITPSSRSSVDD